MARSVPLFDIIDAIQDFAALGRCLSRVLALTILFLLGSSVASAQLNQGDLDRLAAYSGYWVFADDVDKLSADRKRQFEDASARARTEFGGRATDIASQFLTNTERKVRNEAYWFVLGALADVQAATMLIRALPEPPHPIAGVLARDQAEISIALETMLASPTIAESEAVTSELIKAAQVRTQRSGPPTLAVPLLGRCRTPAARAALGKLLSDPDGNVRGLAAKALGESGSPAYAAGEVPLQGLIQVLERDNDARARIAAAGALGGIASPQAIEALNRVIDQERDRQVVDAINMALEKVGSPITDPQRCRAILDRSWEPQAARFCFQRWRTTVDEQALLEAAERGSPVLRILAINTLIERPAPTRLVRPQLISPREFDAATRDRLLTSLAGLLTTQPHEGSTIISFMAQSAIWEVSGHDVLAALPYVDRVAPMSARYAALKDLASHDAETYARARRPRQLFGALAVALVGALLVAIPAARPVGACVLASGLIWALWTWRATDIRDLPPPSLMFLTIPAIALLGGGVVAGISTSLKRKWQLRGALRVGLFALTVLASAGVAMIVVAVSRSNGIFPVGESLEVVFETLGAGILAGVWTTVLFVGLSLARRVTGTSRGVGL